MLKKIYNNKEQTRIEKFLTGIMGILFLFYVVSCGSSSTTPSSSSSLSSIRALTLEGVDKNSITLSWKLLTTEEGTVDPTIGYTVYAETNNGTAFTKDSITESTYPITAEDMADGQGQVEVSNLQVNNLYRIVVEARDDLGGSSKSHLLAYTASELAITNISGVVVTTTTDSREVTVTWNSNDQAQGYLVQATDRGNEFGGTVSTDDIIEVICLPGSLLCEGKSDQFADEVEEGKLKYVFQVNKQGGRYKVVVVPFNFWDLVGLQAVDEEGKVQSFAEGVLERVKAEGSLLKTRLADALNNKVDEAHIQVSKAGAPVDLELESTGNTISASWGHGVGAESYYAIITTNEEVYTFTNIVDRNETNGRFTGGGYTIFTNLVADTLYRVTVQSFTVVSNSTTMGGKVSATISTKDVSDTLGVPQGVSKENLTLTNEAAGILRIVWDTPETNSVIGYNVFYWVGNDAPSRPQYVAGKGETNLRLTVSPDSYNVRVDVLSTYPEQEVVAGEISSITIYGKPSMPRDLGVVFSRGSFINIDGKLYATGYPLSYTGADTLAEAGGPLANVSYHYRYRVEGGVWNSYSKAGDEVVVSLMVDDLSDPAVIKSGYGKRYQVELVASNDGGFVSEAATLGFTYKSFPEPLMVDKLTVDAGDRKLTVTWNEVSDKNGATVANYTVVLNTNPYALPVRSTNTVERRVVFEGLENNQAYLITVIPNGKVTGNILTALSLVTGYEIGTPIGEGSEEAMILGAYTGVPELYTPQGAPEVVINLIATIEGGQATVNWEKASAGSPATGYVLEYLSNVTTLISNIYTSGDAADAELGELDWTGAVSTNIVTNDSGSYSEVIDGLNISTATNVFRVRAVRLDEQGKEWPGEYRYYAMGSDVSRPPNTVGNLAFTVHNTNSFRVTWNKPNSWGKDRDGTDAQSVGYRVSWENTAELGNTNDINNADTLFYEITGLTAGTQYYVKVEAKNDNADENIYSVESTGNTYTLKPPGQVDASTIAYSGHTANGFTVSWARVTDLGYGSQGQATSVSYLLELKAGDGNWGSVNRRNPSATTETLTGLTSGTRYQVRVTVSNGSISAAVSEGGATYTLAPPGQVNVSSITYSDHTTNGFTVSWTGVTDLGYGSQGQATSVGYFLERSVNQGAWQPIDRSDYSATTEDLTGLTPGTRYQVRVIASNSYSKAAASEGGDTYTLKLPGQVKNIAYSDHTTNSFTVSWDAVTDAGYGPTGAFTSVGGYRFEWSGDQGGSWEEPARSDYTATTESISNLNPGTRYRVRITATNDLSSVPSEGDTWTLSLPGRVGSLVVSDPTYDGPANKGGFKVSWTVPSDTGLTAVGTDATVTGYEVAYAEKTNTVVEYITITNEITATEYVFADFKTNAEYDIRVRARTAAGTGAENHVSGWTPSLPAAVDPDSISLSSRITATTLRITWSVPQAGQAGGASSSNATTQYKVEVSPVPVGEGTYSTIDEDHSGNIITATGLSKSTTYRARITAKNVWGEAAASVSTNTETTLATDATPPSAVENLNVESTTTNQVVLSWTAPTNAGTTDGTTVATISSYVVKYKTGNNSFVEIDERGEGVRLTGALTGDSTNATVTGLSASTTYQFIVVAVNSGNMTGAEPSPVNGITKNIPSPTNLRQVNTCAKTTSVDLTWDASAGATFYRVYRGSVNSVNIATPNANSYTDTGLSAGTSYTYTVEVCTDAGCSAKSQPLDITTLSDKSLKGIIDLGSIPTDLDSYDQRYQDIFSRYAGGSALVARYLKPDGTGDGSSLTNAAGNLKTVLEGIGDASASKVYAVLLTEGNYKAGSQMAMKNHVAIIGGLDECLDPSLDQVTELDGNNAYRVFYNDNNGLTNTSLLYEVTITNGRDNLGGGMYNDSSSPSLVEVTFSGNTANGDGGGMVNYNDSRPSLSNVTFSGNSANNNGGGMANVSSSPSLVGVTFSGNTANGDGGGMYNNSSSSPSLVGVTFSGNTAGQGGGMGNSDNSRPILSNVTFSGNTADNYGGGMYNSSSSSPILSNVTFSENTVNTDYGGGMYNQNSSPSLVGVTFSGNKAIGTWGHGGGMYNYSSSPSLVGVTFSGNTANGDGGGMYNNSSSSPSLVGVTFSGNTAGDAGGGMYNYSSSPSLVEVTFSGNTANRGGGMYNFDSSSPSLVGVTFSGNSADYGGGMHNWESSPSLVGVTFSGNSADNGVGGGMYNSGSSLIVINGIFWGNTAVVHPEFNDLQPYNSIVQGEATGTAIITTDPGLGTLADNGGAVWTHAIESTSPAVNQGLYVRKSGTTLYYSVNNTDWYTLPDLSGTAVTVPAGAEDLTATDATGYKRTGRPDLGAYEAR